MKKLVKVAITTLGCKVNQFESASFATGFAEAGCELVPFSHAADVYVINTCTVTAKAGQQSRQLIRKAIQTNPDARIIVTGCYAQMAPDAILDIVEHRACLVGNDYKHLIVDTALQEEQPELVVLMGRISNQEEICLLPVRRFGGRTRTYLRIQDGCNNFCSYCIVPYTRGPSRSLSLEAILKQTAIFSEEGYREMVITGINVGKYGLDLDQGETIYSLLDRLCREFPQLRIRLSSIEPTEVNPSLLELISRHANFMPHLHIPLQSGDDEVLRRMYRQYTVASFREVIHQVHQAMPHGAIGCDVLGGFPGETEAQAENTFQTIADLPISYLHVFPYSKRPGTLASFFSDQIPGPVKNQRVKRLRTLDEQLRTSFYQSQLGSSQRVLVERRHTKSGLLQGFSENYLPLHFNGPSALVHQIASVRFDHIDNGQPIGIIHDQLDENNQETPLAKRS
ncbi:tRNA (N(6)-L-threonylcarbamoyladenosine(37)-C(2))-methylthiotransferase MtaB [Desulfogranum mediterraneum]|uniref:tRNA (N(6)-L-threonylcarbamoyladenosine(37)-C(2))- methylthiotransferase MtaB n=1 Tax=Desulfogranum mediterraneum TaxID=160661 RepID=UPI00041A27A0|nr:tRNA (N(6)-L-threonylcarbamoyladenosine(37)-C(2))-methylthiotransferase MtaB [Desulfogranum mediterraneum]